MPQELTAHQKPRHRGGTRCVNTPRYRPRVSGWPGPLYETLACVGDIGLKVQVPAMWRVYTVYGTAMQGLHAQPEAPAKDRKVGQYLASPYFGRDRGPRMHWQLHGDTVFADACGLREYVANQIASYKAIGGAIRSGRRRYRIYGTLVGFEFEVWHMKSRRALRLFFGHQPGRPTIRLEYEAPIGRTDESLLARCWGEVRYLPSGVIEKQRVVHG